MSKRHRKSEKVDRPRPAPEREQTDEELQALAADAEREMYGDDYDYLRDSGWLDR